ncbi:MAG: hypothetical protein IJR29_08445 [Butyrivibrio sp.]|nr:hypothetical protein [Butyrivibrio sp.]
MEKYQKTYKLFPKIATKIGNTIWACQYGVPILFCYDLNCNTIVLVKELPNVFSFSINYASSMCCTEGKLFIVPCDAECIVVYDIEKESFSTIELPDIHQKGNLFRDVFVYDDYVICVPARYHKVVKMHPNSLECEYSEESIDSLIEGATIFGDSIVAAQYGNSTLLDYNLHTNKMQTIEISGMNSGFVGAYFDGVNNRLYGGSTQGQTLDVIDISKKKYMDEKATVICNPSVLRLNNYLLLYNDVSDTVNLCDEELNLIKNYSKRELGFDNTLMICKIKDDYEHFFCPDGLGYLDVNGKLMIESIDYDNSISECFERSFKLSNIKYTLPENHIVGLSVFINALVK